MRQWQGAGVADGAQGAFSSPFGACCWHATESLAHLSLCGALTGLAWALGYSSSSGGKSLVVPPMEIKSAEQLGSGVRQA